MRTASILVLASCVALPALAQSTTPFAYIRRDTREASRDATLAQHMPVIEPGPWHVVGPFDNTGMDDHDTVFPPEQGVELAAVLTGKDGHRLRWEVIEDDDWRFLDLKRFGPDEADNNYGIAYLHRTFEAPNGGDVTFEMGSDDGIKVWLNGELIVDADAYRGFNINDHIVPCTLARGENTLLVKVTQGEGGWEFQMRPRVDSRMLALLDYYLDRDFPDAPELAHYRPLSVLEPEDVVLEVGGLDVLPDGRPIVVTRRGEVWLVEGAYDDPPFDATYTRFAAGLHEPLGGVWVDDGETPGLLVAQRGEVTKLIDTDGDDRADWFRTVSDGWGVSGNYHEYAFGPEFDGAGHMWVTLNVGFCGSLGKSIVPWRGWAMTVEPDGSLTPVCGGLRSPNGLGRDATGAMFCCDNQGDWVGTNKMMHLDTGDWHGHPAGDRWYETAGMTAPLGEAAFKPPAIWFPYDRMGRSASDILLDDTGGKFGPFTGQLFVGDQYAAAVMRVSLERIDGVYQGACHPFIGGLDSGVNRLAWGRDGSLFVGMTNRGWWSFGPRAWGLQRVVYTGVVPFDVLSVHAQPDGFELRFTKPVDPATAGDPASYALASFTHERWEKYGSPEIDRTELTVRDATVTPDGLGVRLRVDGIRRRYVHEIIAAGVRGADGDALLHDDAYYTLNVIPAAEREIE